MKKRTIGILCSIMLMAMLLFPTSCQQTPLKFEVVSLNIVPAEVTVDEEVTIRAEIKNNSSTIEIYDVPLMVNGVAQEREPVSLAPGASEQVTFSMVKHKPESYEIAIGDKRATLTVYPPPAFQLSELTVSPAEINPKESVTITIEVANTGGTKGKYVAPLKINDVTAEIVTVTVAAGAVQNLKVIVSRDEPGTYTVALGELTKQFVVTNPIIQFGDTDNTQCPPNTRYSQRSGC